MKAVGALGVRVRCCSDVHDRANILIPGRRQLSQNSPLRAARSVRRTHRDRAIRKLRSVSGLRFPLPRNRVRLNYLDTYSYDLANNRVGKVHDVATGTDETITYAYNERDQLTAEDSTVNANDRTYTYDANGSTTSVTTNGSSTVKYVWDLRNRMTGVDSNGDNSLDDAGDIVYGYDDAGNRISRVVVGGASTYYLIDPRNSTGYAKAIEEKSSPTGSPVRSYILGLDVIGQSDATNGTLYLMKDGHGTTRALVNSSGSVVERYDFDAFGNKVKFVDSSGTDLTGDPLTTWLMPDGYRDFATSFDRTERRDVNGRSGRMLNVDPRGNVLGDTLNSNLYVYASNNPVYYTDPSGMFSLPELGMAAGIGALLGTIGGGAIGGAYGYAKTGTWKGAAYGAALGAVLGGVTGGLSGALIYAGGTVLASSLGATVAQGQAAAAALLAIPDKVAAWYYFAKAYERGDDVDMVFSVVGIVAAHGGLNLIASQIAGRLPRRMVRVIDADLLDLPNLSLGKPGARDAFVTGAADVEGISSAQGLAERLTLLKGDGTLDTGPKAIIEFDTPDGVAVPVFRENEGFVPGGYTGGQAREFVVPNAPVSSLKNVTIRRVQ